MHKLMFSLLAGIGCFLFSISQSLAQNGCRDIIYTYSNSTVTLISAKDIAASERVPAYCKIRGTISPDIGFEVRLPHDWNGRFYMVGNEGSGGKINTRNMGLPLSLKYATASTDLGHNGYMEEDNYGFNNRQKVIDYGFRATHLTAVISKEIIANYYDKPAKYSYFVAGSAGARQGMMEAQRFPEDFDGILISAPVYNISAVHMWGIWKAMAFSGEGYVHPDKIEHLAEVIYARCDSIDGVADGVIDDPLACEFDPALHLKQCHGSSDCFTPSQIEALNKVYSGVRNSSGKLLFPGQPLGAEIKGDQPSYMRTDGPQSAWINSIVFEENQIDRYVEFAQNYMRYMAFPKDNPNYRWQDFDFDKDPARLVDAADITDAVDTDLSYLKASGAKVIHYHHWADTAVPASNSIAYVDQVRAKMGDISDFYKFYLVPGGFHGAPGVGATNIPWLKTITDWVEHGIEPGELVAKRLKNKEVLFSRKICPYPQKGAYKGSGDNSNARSFECVP